MKSITAFGALLASLASLPTASAVNASFVGVFRSPGNAKDCNLLAINPNDGSNTTVASVDICASATQTYPAYSVYAPEIGAITMVVSTAPFMATYDVVSGAKLSSFPLPAYNISDEYIGLVNVPNAGQPVIYLLQQSGVYLASEAGLQQVISAQLPPIASVTNKGNTIYVGDESSSTIYVIDMSLNKVSTITSGVSKVWDMQYSASLDVLVELAAYQLYVTDTTTGVSKKVMDIPDGPGYPRVNGMSQDGTMFYFMDFASIYTISMSNFTITSKAPFTAAPRVVGFPVYV